MKRRSGILLHPTSLPGPYPTGDFGESAYRFVDWLARSGQTLWQVLPLSAPDDHGSPYASHSAFGISSIFIDPQQLRAGGLLTSVPKPRVYKQNTYFHARQLKQALVERSYEILRQNRNAQKKFKAFCAANAWWLDDHALFDAIKKKHGGASWVTWPVGYKRRTASVLKKARLQLHRDITIEKYAQWLAHQQWLKLKRYANKKGILIIGDLPFFVQNDSVDVWVHPNHFLLNRAGRPAVVAGAPPDMFTSVGQRWGNPHYNWKQMKQTRYRWWHQRAQYAATLFDSVRLDHFRGFQALWHVAAKDGNAKRGRWVPTPGVELLNVITSVLPATKLIAEDVGYITREVVVLRDRFNLAGMRVSQFGFYDNNRNNVSLPHTYPQNSVAYTGTHDTAPLRGWLASAHPAERRRAVRYTQAMPMTFTWALMRKNAQSRARWTIAQMQDVLNLGNQARMNKPNTVTGNWMWRFAVSTLTTVHARRLRQLAVATKRY